MANTEQKKTNKSRMLFILRYLMQNTNEDHMVSLSDLMDICAANGFGRPNRRTIISDIRELTESEYPIEVEEIGQTNYYYYSGHLTPSELRVLVDAVEAAQFITKKDSLVLMEKLIKLSNWRDEDYYLNSTLLEGCRKTDNKNMKYILLTIQDAIREKKKIMFQYYDYNLEGEKILHNDGEEYVMSPYGFHCDGNRYYLIGFLDKRNDINIFRLDLISSAELIDGEFVEAPEGFNLNEYCNRIFEMFSGTQQLVTIEVENELMKKVIDRFGEQLDITPVDDKKFRVKVDAAVSQTFFGWVFQYNGGITIVEPIDVKQQYEDMLNRALQYSESINLG